MRTSPLLLLALVLSACGGSSGSGTSAAPTQAAPTQAAGDPASCLTEAGLTDVVQQTSTGWRGNHTENGQPEFYAVFVEKFPSAAKAARLVADAVDVYAEQAGVYAITGPARTGSTMSSAGQANAQALLAQIRDCLSA